MFVSDSSWLGVFYVFPQTIVGQHLHERLILRLAEFRLHLRRSFEEIRAHQVMQNLINNRRALLESDLQVRVMAERFELL
jgi:hypothetical protein